MFKIFNSNKKKQSFVENPKKIQEYFFDGICDINNIDVPVDIKEKYPDEVTKIHKEFEMAADMLLNECKQVIKSAIAKEEVFKK